MLWKITGRIYVSVGETAATFNLLSMQIAKLPYAEFVSTHVICFLYVLHRFSTCQNYTSWISI